MKTEFNVERVCERVHMCIVDAPDELGQASIEVRGGSIYVSFPAVSFTEEQLLEVTKAAFAAPTAEAADAVLEAAGASLVTPKTKRKGR